ncbi:radical SAM protein [Cetobacterium sp.]|uniref:radical SAM protein n=1 Tax=Cetobacterium sp. TaxID=2071632 RepID=UPI003F2C139B
MKAINRLPKMRVSIIDKCQLKCSFCGGNDTHMENFQPIYMKKFLSDDERILIFKKYFKYGGKYIQFTGGEPLLYKNILNIVKETFAIGCIPEINTNGIALTEEVAKKLKENGLKTIKVSIPSFNKEKYKEITGIDCLEKVKKNIMVAQKYLNVRINTVAMKSNFNEIKLAIDTIRELGVKQLLFLELLYYHDIKDDSKEFFQEEHIDIKNDVAPVIEEYLGSLFNEFEFYKEYNNTL